MAIAASTGSSVLSHFLCQHHNHWPVVPSTNPDVAAIVGCVGVIGACRSLRTCDHDYLGDSTSILATSLSHRRLLSRQSSCRVTLRRTDHGKRRYSCINLLY
ncbi:hypothetical protein AAHA92_22479 [Salvia divinorum]|uniref:Uncharacterized protein n=1 Tax=Salvia divinorum TaxID=28513 RepID=A0ABD1GNT7_SALDI